MRTLGKTWILNKVFNRDTDALKVELGNDENGPLLTSENPASVVLRGNDGSIIGTTDDPLKVDIGSIQSDYTETNPSGDSIQVTNKPVEHTFHDAAAVAADGTVFGCDGQYNKLLIEISRATVTSNEIQFLGNINGTGAYFPLLGAKIGTDASITTNVKTTSTTAELWEIDVTGYKYIKMDLTALVDGAVTVKGVLV